MTFLKPLFYVRDVRSQISNLKSHVYYLHIIIIHLQRSGGWMCLAG